MSSVEAIRSEIERRIEETIKVLDDSIKNNDEASKLLFFGKRKVLIELRDFIDSLPQEPSEDLEEAADEYENGHTFQRYDGGGLTPEYNATLAESFIAGAKWKELQMLKERVGWNPDFLKDIDEAEKPWTEAELWAEEHKDKVSNLNSAKFGYAYGYHARDKQLKANNNEKD